MARRFLPHEINPPPGYTYSTVTDSVRTIVLEEGVEDIVLKFDNKKLPTLIIKKVDSRTGEPISGVTYSVVGTDDTSYQPSTATTDENGLIEIVGLPEGTYTVTEISSPYEYILNSTPQTVKLEAGNVKTLLYENIKYPTLVIYKYDYSTNKPIAGATFQITRTNSDGSTTVIGTYQTNSEGYIILEHMEPGWYTYTETIPAQGYSLPSNPTNTIYLEAGANAYGTSTDVGDSSSGSDSTGEASAYAITYGSDYEVVGGVVNYPLNSIVIKKSDANTGEMLAGATFEVIRATGETSGTNGTVICTVTTDVSGVVVITGLEAGSYVVKEITAPNGYIISETNLQSVTLKADGTSIVEVIFNNYPYGSISINKVDGSTGQPLQGATFSVTDAGGNVIGDNSYTTDANGNILVDGIAPGTSVVVTETSAPDGYAIDTTPQTVLMDTSGGTKSLTFTNYPYGSLLIRKYDSSTKELLAGATFTITDSEGKVVGNSNGIYKTDESGTILLSNLAPGSYIVTETQAPDGYVLSDNPSQTIKIEYTGTYTLDFYNAPMVGLTIQKLDSQTKEALAGAVFEVWRLSDSSNTSVASGSPAGTLIGTYTTDYRGLIEFGELEDGTYTITEIQAPDGYKIDNASQQVTINSSSGRPTTVTFTNTKEYGVEIIKIDSETREPLQGAQFQIWETSASSSTSVSSGSPAGTLICTYTTDVNGIINVVLPDGVYEIIETVAPDGYILSDVKQDIVVKAGEKTSVTFTNTKEGGLKIVKTDSSTGEALEGVEFLLEKINGERIGTYKTNSKGIININNIAAGWYCVTETSQLDGYKPNTEIYTVEVVDNKTTVLEVENIPYASLLIKKTDASTDLPLEGVRYLVTKANGETVGTYKTDSKGRILITGLEAGDYEVSEVEALSGYQLDTEVYTVKISEGKRTTIELENVPLAGLRLHKVDSITGEGIYNVEFMVFDSNNKVVGNFYTDNNGYIDFSAILTEGRYTIRETRAADGYYLDEVPRTVEFVAGKVTEITWENTPETGQIQITKLSADDNEITGLPAGTPLAGAVFEVYSYKSGNLIDRFVTGNDGRGVSKALPLGRYVVKEVQAPSYYSINTQELDVTIEFATQIVKLQFTNSSANTGVSIDKTGPAEVISGQEIRWVIQNVRNDSTIPLSSFFWRDVLPTDAIRLTKIVTGTYSQSLKYKITVTTNKGNTMVIADNLQATKNNVIDCSSAALGLASDEYVVSFIFYFGTVKVGFTSVDTPMIYGQVLSTGLPSGYIFANKVDVGGKNGNEWVIGNDTVTTKIYSTTPTVLPKTGN